jgi:hypothetical protein
MPLVDGGAHTVLPLCPCMMIRRSKGRILRDGSGTLAPSPAPEPFIRPRAAEVRPHGRPALGYPWASAMERSRSAIVLEVITAAAMVALVLCVLFPPN